MATGLGLWTTPGTVPAYSVRPCAILLDYRPALRQRTGVGEYVHELAAALVATAPRRRIAHAVLVVLEGPPRPDACPGADVVDRRVPVRALNFAWHRLGWPPVERWPAAPFDVVAVGASAADSVAARRAGRHHRTISTFSTTRSARAPRSGATTPRWPRRTPGGPIRSSSISRAHGRATSNGGSASRASQHLHLLVRARPPGRRASAEPAARRLHPVSRHARAAKESRRAPRRLRAAASRDRPDGAAARARRPRTPDAASAIVARARRRAARRPRRAARLHRPTTSASAVSSARSCSCMPSHTEGSACPSLEAHDGRRAGRRRQPRRAARSRRRRRPARRPGRRRGARRGARRGPRATQPRARPDARRRLAPGAREFTLGATPRGQSARPGHSPSSSGTRRG